MGSISGDELSQWDVQRSSAHEERILVSVRLRPLNDREMARNDASDWECINSNTIVFKNSIVERSMFPTAYTFDRVFGCDSSTKQVYEEGAKEVALSAVSGINSTIFAYGQTSSGKTHTMSGITENTITDVFDYISTHKDREFVLKFSAMEIYNESVRDLLSSDSTPLRLLDDPERGTVVDKVTEETVKDWSHLNELLSVCEAQRRIGETSLNELSSRSHQILRLTIESSGHEFLGCQRSSTLTASVNFVDLAGSERASQALSAGARLKEGCHINRSLLTLGTVIRKLSKGRNGHVPYRDSKLTRILQNSLGGNARTAIICTMSPAHSHVEQSRNTLLFASCAKEVSTNAHVNLVMSDKALVKQLQRELAKLESEFRNSALMSGMPNSAALLKEKELLIEKMDKEIKELKEQRDCALSRVRDLLGSSGEFHEYQVAKTLAEDNPLLKPYVQRAWVDECSASESSDVIDPLRSDVTSSTSHLSDGCDGFNSNKNDFHLPENSDDHFLSDDISPRETIEKFFGPDPSQGWEMAVLKHDEESEDHCKEVQCIEESSVDSISKSNAVIAKENGNKDLSDNHMGHAYKALRQKIQDMQKTITYLVNSFPKEHSSCSSEAEISSSRSAKLSRSRSCKTFFTASPWFEKAENHENTPPNGFEKDLVGRPKSGFSMKLSGLMYDGNVGKSCGKGSPVSVNATSLGEKEQDIKILLEGDASSVESCTAELNEVVKSECAQQFVHDLVAEAKPKTEALVEDVVLKSRTNSDKVIEGTLNMYDSEEDIILEVKPNTSESIEDTGVYLVQGSLQSPSNWPMEFLRQQKEIIELWDVCNAPLIHRTRFFLLFRGDPSDSVYMEVELRRLSFLRVKLFQGALVIDGQILTLALSKRALNRERRMLCKQIAKKFSVKDREALYQKWGIGLTTKQRRQQLCLRLWTDTKDMNHIEESAALAAKLVGFSESDEASKEMFNLSFLPRPIRRSRSFTWS